METEEEEEEEEGAFIEHLKNYGGEWFWEDIQWPDGTEWMAEAMKNGTLTSVTDGSYMEHLHRNMSGAGWIIQDRASGKRVQVSLAEWSTTAGSYRGKLLGMLAVRVLLLAAEEYYRASTTNQTGNSVSCDTMGALHTFAKECKRVPASRSNADIRRTLGEVNRLALNKYSLEHVKGHRDSNTRPEDLSLEAQLNERKT